MAYEEALEANEGAPGYLERTSRREMAKDRGLKGPVPGTGRRTEERGGSMSSEVRQFPVPCVSEM